MNRHRCSSTHFRRPLRVAGAVLLTVIVAGVSSADAAEPYSPDAERSYPTNLYWGDTHVHTSYSSGDANLAGGNYVDPEIAYRFARGEVVDAKDGTPVRLRRPLDFLVISDHAENLGIVAGLQINDQALRDSPGGNDLYHRYQAYEQGPKTSRFAMGQAKLGKQYESTIWARVIERADRFNEPGVFTAFAGYEWSSIGTIPAVFGNLHRVVVFKDDASKTGQIIPFSAYDSRDPEDLWAFLSEYVRATGGDVMAIPHNPNLSHGQMFALETIGGNPLTASYARTRSRWEPLLEMTQLKGDSETHPILSPTDEFADFETWDSWAGTTRRADEHPCCDKLPPGDEVARKASSYARSGLKLGLDLQARLGINPFKFGMIGATDAHTSLATADNDNFWGKYSKDFPSSERMFQPMTPSWPTPISWETAAAGYAGVWAEENTRESIFAAMRRKEVYATTGPRMTVRFFGGWDFETDDALLPDVARKGYSGGVPMGGDLTSGPDGRSPTFLLRATKDPDGANLDRVQIIKGWRDRSGQLHEQVYNVALSDGRQILPDSAGDPVGSTVDLEHASYTNAIGDPELTAVWSDPDFDRSEHAFYYARILQIPTPRWTAFDARFFGIEDIPDEVRMVSQERAYTSPIWYTP